MRLQKSIMSVKSLELYNINEVHTNSQETTSRKCIQIMKRKFFIIFVLFISIILTLICIGIVLSIENSKDVIHSNDAWKDNLSPEQQLWYDIELEELKSAMSVKQVTKKAKNIILFIGDGMGPATITGSRIYKYGEEGTMSWENFPHMGLLKTYCVDRQVPDSISTATALFCGVKVNYKTGGVDSAVQTDDCEKSLEPEHQVDSIIQWAQEVGMSTGFVTNTRVVHATPAALYAHVANRKWECESKMSDEVLKMGCRDIARQLIESVPGRNLNVILGGGRQCLMSNVNSTESDPVDTWSCYSKDGRNLLRDWKRDKDDRHVKNAIVENNEQLRNLDTDKTDFVLGIFANGHLSYEDKRDDGPTGMPSLKEMTSAAIKVLSRNTKNGFLLVVESGLIDLAHHRGWAKRAFSEVIVLDNAVKETLDLMKSKMDETLIIVTSDHSHTLTINGYPERGNSIFGIAQNSKFNQIPYTTLTYGTGHFGYQVEKTADGKLQRHDPSQDDLESFEYVQQVAIKTDENTHGGLDVSVHAFGTMSHLFHKVHEQTYVAHVISYAAKIGRFRDSTMVKKITDFLGI